RAKVAAPLPQPIAERGIVDEELANFSELGRGPVREACTGAAGHAREHRRARVDYHRPSGGPRHERDERKRLEEARHHERGATRKRVPLLLLGKAAEVDDAADLRDADLRVPDEHERDVVRGIARAPAFVVPEEIARSLAHADAAD